MTKIQWTNETWNPVTGCTKVSQGCKHCYAEGIANRRLPHGGFADRPFTEVRCHTERLLAPMSWRRPQRVFVNSMSDLFHEDVPDSFIDQVFAVMALCPQHTFQVLTKRPARMRAYLTTESGPTRNPVLVTGSRHDRVEMAADKLSIRERWVASDWPLPNVWLGVSVEDQATADERIPLLLETPAALRWVSYEPALGPVNFTDVVQRRCGQCDEPTPLCRSIRAQFNGARCCVECRHDRGVDWIVVGGESGPGARPFDVQWARSTVEQCKAAGVACFVKQLGANPAPLSIEAGSVVERLWLRDRKGGDPSEWPVDLRVREWPEVKA